MQVEDVGVILDGSSIFPSLGVLAEEVFYHTILVGKLSITGVAGSWGKKPKM